MDWANIVVGDLDEVIIAGFALSVVSVMLLELAGTGFPSMVSVVYCRDEQVHLITGYVLEMKVASSLFRMELVLDLGLGFALYSLSFFKLQSSRYVWAI